MNINTIQDVFVVWNCEHYEMYPSVSKKMSIDKLTNMKLELARFMWEDVETLSEARRRMKKNLES